LTVLSERQYIRDSISNGGRNIEQRVCEGSTAVRITGISTHVVGTPWRNLTYIQVHNDDGVTGIGETRILGRTGALVGHLREAEANHKEAQAVVECGGRALKIDPFGTGHLELDTNAATEFPQQQARFALWAEGWERRSQNSQEGGRA
jgi:L-alanine-DL-glutamate epimerase-like enolase superfamily enzyme